MLRHIIIWKLKPELSDAEKEEAKANIKAGLEALPAVIDGLEEVTVHTGALPSSNADMMLESKLRDADALEYYRDHPAHQKCVEIIRAAVCDRSIIDFYE